jgi:hypothetical protein
MADLIQLRQDSQLQWSIINPVLAQGEIGLELGSLKFKIGDGCTRWNDLDYWGTQGDTGIQGYTGLSMLGVTGLVGETGLVGPVGETGPIGPAGLTGAPGITGFYGIQGITGSDGITGSCGITGATMGATGIKGLGNFELINTTGFTGVDNSVIPVMIWSLDKEALYVGITGPGGNLIQVSSGSWMGPTGPMGDTGLGLQGVTGVDGIQGLVGETGSIGPAGETGVGLQGETGTSGPTGLQGITGVCYAVGGQACAGINGGSPVGITGVKNTWVKATGWTDNFTNTGFTYGSSQWSPNTTGRYVVTSVVSFTSAVALSYFAYGIYESHYSAVNNYRIGSTQVTATGTRFTAAVTSVIWIPAGKYIDLRFQTSAHVAISFYDCTMSICAYQGDQGATGAPGTIGITGINNPYCGFAGMIEYPATKSYILDSDAPNSYDVQRLSIKTISGTCMATLAINGTPIQPFGAVSVSSTRFTGAATSAYTVPTGGRLVMGITGISSPIDLEFAIKTNRT